MASTAGIESIAKRMSVVSRASKTASIGVATRTPPSTTKNFAPEKFFETGMT